MNKARHVGAFSYPLSKGFLVIISERYGPQFDAVDGTIGDMQLVRRWWVTTDKQGADIFGARQGHHSYETKDKARSCADAIGKNNPGDITYTVGEFWCHPGHFDPVGPISVGTEGAL